MYAYGWAATKRKKILTESFKPNLLQYFWVLTAERKKKIFFSVV